MGKLREVDTRNRGEEFQTILDFSKECLEAYLLLPRSSTLSLSETQSCWKLISNRAMLLRMREVCSLIWLALVGAFRSRSRLRLKTRFCVISITCCGGNRQ